MKYRNIIFIIALEIILVLSISSARFFNIEDIKKTVDVPIEITVPSTGDIENIINDTTLLVMYDSIYNDYIEQECTTYDVPVYIVNRLLYVESKFNPKAINKNQNGTKDLGIAQVNDKYLSYFKEKYFPFDPFNPYESITFCVIYLRSLYEYFGDWYSAIASYNAGITRIKNNQFSKRTIQYANFILYGDTLKLIDFL